MDGSDGAFGTTRPLASPRPAILGSSIGWGLTVAWLSVSALTFWGLAGGEAGLDPLRILMVPVAVFGPVALIWIGVSTTVQLAAIRRELAGSVRPETAAVSSGEIAGLREELRQIAAAQAKTEVTMARFTSIRPRSPEPAPATATPRAQEAMALDLDPAPPSQPPLDHADLIAALQFPADPDDAEGFRALRRAMADRRIKQLVTAAQDTLTLMSQDGVYTDDLAPERARPETWRRFAQGERGPAVAALGGVRDQEAIDLMVQRIRTDTIFRDTAHHFMRLFDKVLAELEPGLSDAEIVALSDTRTARAFMVLGRAMGTFA